MIFTDRIQDTFLYHVVLSKPDGFQPCALIMGEGSAQMTPIIIRRYDTMHHATTDFSSQVNQALTTGATGISH